MYAEKVERLVDRYFLDWDHTYEQVKHEIMHNFEMEASELEKAFNHLEENYRPAKVAIDGPHCSDPDAIRFVNLAP